MNISEIFKSIPNINLRKTNMPNHIAVSMKGTNRFSTEKDIPIEKAFEKEVSELKRFIASIVKLDIPIVTFNIHSYRKGMQNFSTITDIMESYLDSLINWDYIHENKIKFYVIGKWYDLPGRIVDRVKKLISETKDYDSFFVNLCLNYSGQEEIIDSCKLIAKQIELSRIDSDSVNSDSIRENVYTSYFIPPELMIITGKDNKTDGFLLWDSTNAHIFFSDVLWPEFGKKEFVEAIDFYQKVKKNK